MKYTASENIDNFLVDKSHQIESLTEAFRRAETNAFNPEGMARCVLNMENFNHICIVPLFDLHFFGEGMRYDQLKTILTFIKNTANCYCFLGGDTFDLATLSSTTNLHNTKLTNSKTIDVAKLILSTIKHKMLFGLGGNHDGEQGGRNKDTNLSMVKSVLTSLGVNYFQYDAFLEINLLVRNQMGNYNTQKVSLLATHGSGGASSKAGAIDTTWKKCAGIMAKNNVYPDIIYGGHFHADVCGRYTIEKPIFDKNGMIIASKRHEILVESNPTLQGDNEYSLANSMSGTLTNINAFDISLRKNPYYNKATQDREKEYIVAVKKFPLLIPNTCKLTIPATEYSSDEKYKVPEIDLSRYNQVIKENATKFGGIINDMIQENE